MTADLHHLGLATQLVIRLARHAENHGIKVDFPTAGWRAAEAHFQPERS